MKMIKTIIGLQSFISGLQFACLTKQQFARWVLDMYGIDVLNSHNITFESIDDRGHRNRIPITEKMLRGM